MPAKLPTVCVSCYIKLTFLFGFQSVDGLKLGATSSDILDCADYVTVRQ